MMEAATKAIAFFPWWTIDKPLTVGSVRLLTYKKGRSPGDLEHARQADVDSVLGAYSLRPRNRVETATIMEVSGWQSGTDPAEVLSRIFWAREALAFAALAEQRLFSKGEYCNFDTFTLIVQQYQSEAAGTFAYQTRRRDGGTHNLWSSDEFRFQRPLHVHEYPKLSIDEKFFEMLLTNSRSNWAEAIVEFNRANTDSLDVPAHVEMIMMKSAFERLFAINPNAKEFSKALERCISDIRPCPVADGPLKARWKKQGRNECRPVHAWALEFCARRGIAAHGNKPAGNRFVWSEAAHLAFAAMLFPLLFKKCAADSGVYEMSETDTERLSRIDQYVVHDPMAFDEDKRREKHPWAVIDNDARMTELARRLYSPSAS